MIGKILAPTDLSKLSLLGVRYALTAAKHFDAEVSIYHVVNADEIRKLGDSLTGRSFIRSGLPNVLETYLHTYEVSLAQFVGQNFSDLPTVKVDEKVELGSPDKNIVERAKTEWSRLDHHGRTREQWTLALIFRKRNGTGDPQRSMSSTGHSSVFR